MKKAAAVVALMVAIVFGLVVSTYADAPVLRGAGDSRQDALGSKVGDIAPIKAIASLGPTYELITRGK